MFPQVRGSLQNIPFEAHAGFTSLEYTRRTVGDFVFKAFFDKANRASGTVGPGLREGLRFCRA